MGTQYAAVVDRVCRLTRSPELENRFVTTSFDATGIGSVVAEMFRTQMPRVALGERGAA
jgi:hypothetical protein